MAYSDDIQAWSQLGSAATSEQQAAVFLAQKQMAAQQAAPSTAVSQQQAAELQKAGYNQSSGNVQPGQAAGFITQIEQQKAAATANLESARSAYYSVANSGKSWSDEQYVNARQRYNLAEASYQQTMKDSITQYNAVSGAVPTSSGGGGEATGKSKTFGDNPSPYTRNALPGDIPAKQASGSPVDTGYSGGTFNPRTGETTGGRPSEFAMAQDRAAAGIRIAGGNVSGPNAGEFTTMSLPYVSSLAQARANPGAIVTEVAIQKGMARPNFYNPSDLGDAATQRMIDGEMASQGLWGADAPFVMRQNAGAASALEKQLQLAYATPGTRDDLYFANELWKASLNPGELSSSYHHLGMSMGVPIPANPFEYQGDIGVQLVAGTPTTDKQVFSPVSMLAASYLPNGLGISDYQWETAKLGPGQQILTPNFRPAVDFFAQATGQYGPYGNLFGGPNYQGTPSSEGLRKQAEFSLSNMDLENLGQYAMPGIGAGVSQSVTPERTAIVTGPVVGQFTPMVLPATPGSSGAMERSVGGGMVAGIPTIFEGTPQFPTRPVIPGVVTTGPTGIFSKREGATIGETGITTTFNDIVTNIKNTRWGIGGTYYLGLAVGSNIPEEMRSGISGTILSLPGAQPIKSGMEAFGAWSDLNKVTQARGAQITSLIPEYNRDLTIYNKMLSEYEKDKTQAGYESLMGAYAPLKAKGQNIESLAGDITAAENRYNTLARGIVGEFDQKSRITYPAGSLFGQGAETYRGIVETPMRDTFGRFGWGGNLLVGAATVPTMLLETGQSALIGGETLVRNPAAVPAAATAGVLMMGQGVYNLAAKNPAELLGNVAGMVLLGMAVKGVITRGIGLARTTGMGYQPIEPIGYDAPEGYPIRPGGTAQQLIESFQKGTLNPAPEKMSISERPPSYVPQNARLQTQTTPNQYVLWTAHATDSMIRSGVSWMERRIPAKVGSEFTLNQPGSSELSGISAAPVAEGYFAKVGRAPEGIGIDFGIGSPTIYSTIVPDIETLPGARSMTHAAIDEMIAKQAKTSGKGISFVPMIKAEYEANIPTNTRFEVTGKNYYTKLGGYGSNHFMGIRVPIVELKTIGYEADAGITGEKISYGGSSYRAAPTINIIGLPASISSGAPSNRILPSSYEPPYRDYTPTEMKATGLISDRSTSRSEGSSPSTTSRSHGLSTGMGSSESRAAPDISSILSSRSITPLTTLSYLSEISNPTEYPSVPSSERTPGRTPGSPPTTYITPPGTPYIPPVTPPITPLTPPITPPYLGSGGSGRLPPRRRKRQVELFSFEYAQDTQVPKRYGLGGKTLLYVPGSRGAAKGILPQGDIAPNRLFDIGNARKSGDRL